MLGHIKEDGTMGTETIFAPNILALHALTPKLQLITIF